MTKRINELIDSTSLSGNDGILIFKPVNRLYYASFTGTTGYIYADGQDLCFLTDFRYMEQARSQCVGFNIVEISNDFSMYDFLKSKAPERLYVEENHITMAVMDKIENSLVNVDMSRLDAIIERQRLIKSDSEIENISAAAKIADHAFEHIIEFIKPGMSENEIALELEFFMRRHGAEGLSFETIAASGTRSSMPHGTASEKIVETGDFLTMDFGCTYNGYCSDMTRTVHIGKANDEERKVYNLVLRAQMEALKHIKDGAGAADVDKIARDIIMENGYGEYFGHGLGHGVGLEVHEEPRLSPAGDKILQSGMVVTDEPGIYIPGRFGVRIEDLVAVRDDGCDVLSASPKELIEI